MKASEVLNHAQKVIALLDALTSEEKDAVLRAARAANESDTQVLFGYAAEIKPIQGEAIKPLPAEASASVSCLSLAQKLAIVLDEAGVSSGEDRASILLLAARAAVGQDYLLHLVCGSPCCR